MTTDTATPVQTYTVTGTGPYALPWPYGTGTVTAFVLSGTTIIDLAPGTDFTVAAEATESAGNLTLSPAAAATHSGRALVIERATRAEQGWQGATSRERGLEAQLDAMVREAQEMRSRSDRSLRALVPVDPLVPAAADTVLIWTGTGFATGPSVDDIEAALALRYQIGTLTGVRVHHFIATAGQTAFTGADLDGVILALPGIVSVYLNGVRLTAGTDYSVSATTLTLSEAVAEDDELTIEVLHQTEFSQLPLDVQDAATRAERAMATFLSRPLMLTALAADGVTDGKVYFDGRAFYVGQTGATAFADRPGLLPVGIPSAWHWGADPASGDNTAAFNGFFAYIRARAAWSQITAPHVVEDGEVCGLIPAGRYRCNGSVNGAFIRGVGWTVQADGAEIVSYALNKAALDLLGSRWGTIRGLKIAGDSVATPRTGFQIAACFVGGNPISSDGFVFDRCKTEGYFSLSAVYNMASETSHHIAPIYFNRHLSPDSYCLVLDGISHFAATSDYQAAFIVPQGYGRISNIQHMVLGGEIRKFSGGPAIWMCHTKQVRMIGTYAVSFDDAAVVMVDDGDGQPCFADIDLDLHCETEGLQHCIRFEQLGGTDWFNIFGFRFRDHAPFAANSIFKVGASVPARVILHNADVQVPQYITLPTHGLTEETAKLYINGNLYAGAALMRPLNFAGRLTTDLRSAITQWPVGRYSVHDATVAAYRRGAIDPNELLTIADDTATWITPPASTGKTEIFASTVACGEIAFNTATPTAVAYNAGASFAVATGILSGTTGTDGRLTVSAHTDGRLYIENRLGATATVRVLHRIGGTL